VFVSVGAPVQVQTANGTNSTSVVQTRPAGPRSATNTGIDLRVAPGQTLLSYV